MKCLTQNTLRRLIIQQNVNGPVSNRPRSIYQYSSTAPRLSGQNCKFFKFLLSLNSQKRLGYKENNTKYRILTRKPRSHVRILIYRTWPIPSARYLTNLPYCVTHRRSPNLFEFSVTRVIESSL